MTFAFCSDLYRIRSDPTSRVGFKTQVKLPLTLGKVCPRRGRLESGSFERGRLERDRRNEAQSYWAKKVE